MNDKTKRILKIIGAVLALAAIAALCAWLIPLVLSLREPEVQERFRTFIDGFGVWGVFVMLALQVLQIVVAVIPGEPLELMMGLMYGTAGGLALTILGIALGTTLVFFLVKKFGIRFVNKFVNSAAFEKFSFLHDPTRRDSLIFLLFFIPGTPKDVLTYFAPFTGIPFLRFVLISALARIPSVISSTYVGASLSEGNLAKSLIMFAITGAVGLVGIWVNDRVIKHKSEKSENTPSRKDTST
ncbi:MAG: TVP38/TMEM64 family protein [Clostridia bacterium]|nr:TVP38/TMEM64 family protein [Clostridia bacterium]